jgi:hypothetical protein
VIVVGPSGGATGDYLSHARDYAAQARAYGADVTTVFHPHATWGRVLAAAQGANVFIYLGHGNGWPSPYAPYQQLTKDGLGLDPFDGASASNVKYYGEDLIRAQIRLAPGAIVLLNRLCYASGAGESGAPNPSWSTAVKRVDNYAAGFLDSGASTVLADGHTSLKYELARLFASSRGLLDLWRSDPDANRNVRDFPSRRSPGYTVRLDPDRASSGFYRSLVTRGGTVTGSVRVAAYWGTAKQELVLRSAPDATSRRLARVPDGARFVTRGALVTDGQGRTWVPVMTRRGGVGFVAAWYAGFSGAARPRRDVILRSGPSTSTRRLATIRSGVRITILRGTADRHDRSWLKVRTPSGRTGWIAAWLTAP